MAQRARTTSTPMSRRPLSPGSGRVRSDRVPERFGQTRERSPRQGAFFLTARIDLLAPLEVLVELIVEASDQWAVQGDQVNLFVELRGACVEVGRPDVRDEPIDGHDLG